MHLPETGNGLLELDDTLLDDADVAEELLDEPLTELEDVVPPLELLEFAEVELEEFEVLLLEELLFSSFLELLLFLIFSSSQPALWPSLLLQ
jgi:hypothetical protein